MPYPDKCIRGIPNDSCLCLELAGPVANTNLFPFDQGRQRADGWIPESINWMDEEGVIAFTLTQEKEGGGEQFKAGIAILPRSQVDVLRKTSGLGNSLDYERDDLPGNDWHGNILLKAAIPKSVKGMIRSWLALASEVHLRSPKPQEG